MGRGYSCYSARVQVFRTCSALIWVTLSLVACQKEASLLDGEAKAGSGSAGKTGSAGMRGSGHGMMTGSGQKPKGPQPTDVDLDSKDILARPEAGPTVYVKHVLVGWADLLPAYRGRMDPAAMKRSNEEAAKIAKDAMEKLKTATDIDPIIKEMSEDPGMKGGSPYKVTAKSQFVPEFKKLALRLQEKEVGIVKTNYGYHVMIRVPQPPLDPLESADILARPKKTDFAEVQHILIGWKESPAARDPRAKARDKAAAETLAKDVLAKVKAGGDMAKLMKEYSEDPGSKDTGRAYTVTEDEQLVEPFINIGLRLDVGEAGIVKTEFGFHIIKRVKPDSLNSTEILSRTPNADKAKIKYILLGYTDAHIDDERGKKRTRAELEKLVADTLARLKKPGTKFEDVMKELSEDKQSAPTGMAIESSMQGLPSMLKLLGTRLKIDEVGAVKTQFGVFIIKRVDPDAPPVAPGAGSGSAAAPSGGNGSTPKPAGSGSAAAPAGGPAKQ